MLVQRERRPVLIAVERPVRLADHHDVKVTSRVLSSAFVRPPDKPRGTKPSPSYQNPLRPAVQAATARILPGWHRVLVSGRTALKDHGLGLFEREQPLASAFAADAGLLEPAERNAEVGAEGVARRRRGQRPHWAARLLP
jgi:hypothetical protein